MTKIILALTFAVIVIFASCMAVEQIRRESNAKPAVVSLKRRGR